ncbi:hypothetical protein FQN54_003446 [Arachnomyces sp. PD_36]|nr:hypothetical protein FQN54_003446 [Arachnomyces sp. PD_36]
MSYGGSDNPMYGGGGSSGANYYDTSANFNDQQYKGPSQAYASEDFSQAIGHAQQHHSEEDTSIFSQAVDFIGKNKHRFGSKEDDEEDLDESQAVNAHQALYGGGASGSGEKFDERSLGAGAAMQALKMFTSGQEGSTGSGGHDQNKLIGLAMAQAGKAWEEQNQGGNVKTDKQSAVNNAAKMALKMYMKNQGSSGGVGGGLGGTGGPGGLGSLAQKFLFK